MQSSRLAARHDPVISIIVVVVLAFIASAVTMPSSAQQLTEVRFPATQETSLTDCVTPTTLALPGGKTVTFRGGQFIHYEDANFIGTMYATSSAAGCQRMPPDYSIYPPPAGPASEVTVTFSQPLSSLTRCRLTTSWDRRGAGRAMDRRWE